MTLTREQINQVEIIKFAFKRDENKDLNDSEALTFALEFTSAVLVNSFPAVDQVTVPLAGTKSVLN